jgi:hypothetical protein
MFSCSHLSQFTRICHKFFFICSLPALHQKFDLPAPFVLHTDCPHYWRFCLPGTLLLLFLCTIPPRMLCLLNDCFDIDETEEEFSTRLANNLENLILKEGPETVKHYLYIFLIMEQPFLYFYICFKKFLLSLPFSDCCFHC